MEVASTESQRRMLLVATVAQHIVRFHLPLLRLLQERGFRVDVACNADTEIAAPEVDVLHVPFKRSPWAVSNIRAYSVLRQMMLSGGYSLVHVHTPVAAFWVRLAARGTRVPVLYTVHGFHFYVGAPLHRYVLFWAAERLVARWTRAIIVMNSEDWRAAIGLGYRPGENLFFVGGVGVPIEQYECGQPATVRREGTPPTAICIGELNPDKNHATLLRAWAQVVGAHPGAQLAVVGDGRLRKRLRHMALKRGIASNVQFLGWRDDVPDMLARSDVVVHPSRREGLPRVIMEAMAAGKPTVASDVRGSRDLIRDQVNGILVPWNDPAALAAAVIRLFADGELRDRLGAAGRRMVMRFSQPRVLEEVWAVYSAVLNQDPLEAAKADPDTSSRPMAT